MEQKLSHIKLIKELKQSNQDFEFYPTTQEMIKVVFDDLKIKSQSKYHYETGKNYTFLDIGCGDCRIKKYFKEFYDTEIEFYKRLAKAKEIKGNIESIQYKIESKLDRNTPEYKRLHIDGWYSEYHREIRKEEDYYIKWGEEKRLEDKKEEEIKIKKLEEELDILNIDVNQDLQALPYIQNYYVIEKSKILINTFDKDTILVATDFNQTTLIDKKADIIFCNPPYSEYEIWFEKILKQGVFNIAYLVIPQRWKNNKRLNDYIENKFDITTIYTGDFLEADRQARAKIDILKITKKENLQHDPFKDWFEEFFEVKVEKKKKSWEVYRQEQEEKEQREKKKEELFDNELALGKSIDQVLVNLYNQDINKLITSHQSLSTIDAELLKELNVDLYSVMEALKLKIKNLKTAYWKDLFNKLEKITDRLTYRTRELLISQFQENTNVDFTIDNIYAVVLWVIKNANQYFENQIVDVFFQLTKSENIKNYKSNQKTWSQENWRYKDQKHTHYTLDYRLIMSCYDAGLNYNRFDHTKSILSDLIVIANNLGFHGVCKSVYIQQDGKRRQILHRKNNKFVSLIEYKAYKNGNLHLFLDIEFIKAINIEVSRLLGWIKNKEDIKREFDDSLDIKDADIDKYFKSNHFIALQDIGKTLLIEAS